jgi:hypothetical protein
MPPNAAIDHLSIAKEIRAQVNHLPRGTARGCTVTNGIACRLVGLGEDAGLLSKPAGTNHNGFAVDIVAYKSGETFDCLIDGEGVATAAWSQTKPTGHMPNLNLWRPPVDPHAPSDGGPGGDQDPAPPDPVPVPLNVTGIEARLDRLIAGVEEQSVQIADLAPVWTGH